MPNRFYVPGCKSGFPDYPKDLGKFTMFSAPKDEKLLKRGNEFIPRKGALKPSSKVCSHHFASDHVVKGRWIEGKDGKRIFYPGNNWMLKEGAILFIFPNCPYYLSKPKKTVKKKLPTERKPATRKRRKKNTDMELEDIVDDLPENW
ncbi:hypothetical protein OUZ56_011267 [Daphnia magna]|uniref:THAP-type domain-containing protein n=1 Tax=Daphnia magna TaxID=35525 RepID=A0ABQ9YZM8_9CRUS|nr:hypothetical protein OUZ56_011267 [Daphnia magna]